MVAEQAVGLNPLQRATLVSETVDALVGSDRDVLEAWILRQSSDVSTFDLSVGCNLILDRLVGRWSRHQYVRRRILIVFGAAFVGLAVLRVLL